MEDLRVKTSIELILFWQGPGRDARSISGLSPSCRTTETYRERSMKGKTGI